MAAAFLRRVSGDRLGTASTAVKSVDASPMAAEVMREVGVDINTQEAKPVAQSLKEHFAVVVTLSDDTKERSPVWPFAPRLVHWSLPDPASTDGAPEQQREMFRKVRDEIARRVTELANRVAPQLEPQRQ
jgi:protein-tyrosine-phosphatase